MLNEMEQLTAATSIAATSAAALASSAAAPSAAPTAALASPAEATAGLSGTKLKQQREQIVLVSFNFVSIYLSRLAIYPSIYLSI